MERMAVNDDNKDDDKDANHAKGTGGGAGKDLMPAVPTEQGQ